jgi:hypothetical protein
VAEKAIRTLLGYRPYRRGPTLVPIVPPPAVPTNAAPLPHRVASAQSLELEWHLARPKRGLSR